MSFSSPNSSPVPFIASVTKERPGPEDTNGAGTGEVSVNGKETGGR